MGGDSREKGLRTAIIAGIVVCIGLLLWQTLGNTEADYRAKVIELEATAHAKLQACRMNKTESECRTEILSLNALHKRTGKQPLAVPGDPESGDDKDKTRKNAGAGRADPSAAATVASNSESIEPESGIGDDEAAAAAKPVAPVAKFPPEAFSFKLDGDRYLGTVKFIFADNLMASAQVVLQQRPVQEEQISDEEFAAGRKTVLHKSTSAQLAPSAYSPVIVTPKTSYSLSGQGRTVVEVGGESKRIVTEVNTRVEVDAVNTVIRGYISIDSQPKEVGGNKHTVLSVDDEGQVNYYQKFQFETAYTPKDDGPKGDAPNENGLSDDGAKDDGVAAAGE